MPILVRVTAQNTIPGLLFMSGVVLIVAGILGGGVKLMGAEVDPLAARDTRISAVAIGAVLLAASLWVGFTDKGHPYIRRATTAVRTALAFLATVVVVVSGVYAVAKVTEPSPTAAGVPNVYGMPLAEARTRIESARYAIGRIENVCSNSISVAGVVRQVYAAGGHVILVDEPPIGVTADGKALAPGSSLVLKVANGSGC